jgi:hypothetical protein
VLVEALQSRRKFLPFRMTETQRRVPASTENRGISPLSVSTFCWRIHRLHTSEEHWLFRFAHDVAAFRLSAGEGGGRDLRAGAGTVMILLVDESHGLVFLQCPRSREPRNRRRR